MKNEKRNKCLDLPRELKKFRKLEVTVMPVVIGALKTSWKLGLEELEIGKRAETNIGKIGQGTEKNPGELSL